MILGQADLAAATLTDIYTVPIKFTATVRVLVTERAGNSATWRLALRPAGASIANKHYVVYDLALAANSPAHSVPIELAEKDVVSVYASTGDVSVTVTGVEEANIEE